MRRIAPLLALILAIAACGDDDATNTTSAPSTTAASTATTPAPTTTAASTTTGVAFEGPTDCLEIWPEALIQEVAGAAFTFFEANADRSACTYLALPDSIALAWRTGDRANFDASKSGAAVTGEVVEVPVCDTAYSIEIQGAILIMEAYSESQGRVYTTTISGLELTDAAAWSTAILEATC